MSQRPVVSLIVGGSAVAIGIFTAAIATDSAGPGSGTAAGVAGSPMPYAPAVEINDGDLELRAVSDLNQDPFGPRLGNGVVATPSEWPATAVAGSCTATLVGPQVLITAAHCVGNGSKVTIKNNNEPDFTGVCTRHDRWSRLNNLSPDVALCLMAPMSRKGLFFESLRLGLAHVAPGKRLLLGGYGCVDLDTKKPEVPPVFRVGPTVVATAPGGNTTWPNWIITKPATSGTLSFACPGDSGGSVYEIPVAGVRGVVAIISAVNANKEQTDYKASYLTALAASEVKGFIDTWPGTVAKAAVDEKPPQICGVHLFGTPCRPAPQ